MKVISTLFITVNEKDDTSMFRQSSLCMKFGDIKYSIFDVIARSNTAPNIVRYVKVRPVVANNGATIIEVATPFAKIIAKDSTVIAIVFNTNIITGNGHSELSYKAEAFAETSPLIHMKKEIEKLDLLEYLDNLINNYKCNKEKFKQLKDDWYDISSKISSNSLLDNDKIGYKQGNELISINVYYKQPSKSSNNNGSGYVILDLTGDHKISLEGSVLDYIVIKEDKDYNSFLPYKQENMFIYNDKIDENSDILTIKQEDCEDIHIDLMKDNIMTLLLKLYRHVSLINRLKVLESENIDSGATNILFAKSLSTKYNILLNNSIEIIVSKEKIMSIYIDAKIDHKETYDNIFIQKHGEKERKLSDIIALVNMTYSDVVVEAKGSNRRKTKSDIRQQLNVASRYRDKSLVNVMWGSNANDGISDKEGFDTLKIEDDGLNLEEDYFVTRWDMAICIENLFDLPKGKEHIYIGIDLDSSLTIPSVIIDVSRFIRKRRPSEEEGKAFRYVASYLIDHMGENNDKINSIRNFMSSFYTSKEVTDLANKLRAEEQETLDVT